MIHFPNMKFAALPFVLLVACHQGTPPSSTSGASAPSAALPAASSIAAPGVVPAEVLSRTDLPVNAGGCRDFNFYAEDPDHRRILYVYVDVHALALKPGQHRLKVVGTRGVSAELDIYQTPPRDTPACNDVGQRGAVRAATWKATSGELVVDIPKLPTAEGETWMVRVELVNVTFMDANGVPHTFSKRYEPVQVGWLAG